MKRSKYDDRAEHPDPRVIAYLKYIIENCPDEKTIERLEWLLDQYKNM